MSTPSPRGATSRARLLAVACATATVLPAVTLAGPASATTATTPTTFHVAPVASGTGDGSSWADAGDLADVNDFVAAASPGDVVALRSDQGAYPATLVQLRAGGAPGAPVTVRGVDPTGAGRPAVVRGTRADPWLPGRASGSEVVRLLTGADHLRFEHLAFEDVGNGCFRFGGDVRDVVISSVTADNVQRFVENNVSGGAASASVRESVISDVTVTRFARAAVRLRYDSSLVVLRDVHGDAGGAPQRDLVTGVKLEGTAHDVLLERVRMDGAATAVWNGYWNGDGFAAERGVSGLVFRDTSATGNADAGYDLKADDVRLERTTASGNSRSYRFWGARVDATDVVSTDPVAHGGIGSAHHVWLAQDAGPVSLVRPVLRHDDPALVALSADERARATVTDAVWDTPDGQPTEYVAPGATIMHLRTATGGVQRPPVVVASDSFARTVADAWGTADLGGTWSTGSGSPLRYDVAGGVGLLKAPRASASAVAVLGGVSTPDAEVTATLALDAVDPRGGQEVTVSPRRVAGDAAYRAVVRVAANGTATVSLVSQTKSGTVVLGAPRATGATFAAGKSVHVSVSALHVAPTALAVTVWQDGAVRPAPQITATDDTSALRADGGVEVRHAQTSAATGSTTLRVDDVRVTRPAA